jgi:hypothetical protein
VGGAGEKMRSLTAWRGFKECDLKCVGSSVTIGKTNAATATELEGYDTIQ